MTIVIQRLFAHEGPNIYGPQPGVALHVQCDADYGTIIKHALKDGAQFIGMILAYLDVKSYQGDQGWIIEARFTTPSPDLGAALARYVVDGVRATAMNDTEWDREGPLFELQQRRRRQSPPLAALQLVAEARRQRVPVLPLADGRLQFGYGKYGWAFDPQIQPRPTPPWEQLGSVTLYAVSGEESRDQVAQLLADRLAVRGHRPRLLLDADFAASRELLADPDLETAVLSLRSDDLLRRGLPFETCTMAAISDCNGPRPTEAHDDEEWLQALGLPMLVGRGPALLNLTEPRIAALAAYAPHGSIALADMAALLDRSS